MSGDNGGSIYSGMSVEEIKRLTAQRMAKQQRQKAPREGGGGAGSGSGGGSGAGERERGPSGRGSNRSRGGRNRNKGNSKSPARGGRPPVSGKQKEKNARLSSYETAQQTKVEIPLKTGMTVEQLKELTRKRLAAQSYSPPPPAMRIAQKVTQVKGPKTDEPVAVMVEQSDPVYPAGYVAPEGVRTRRRQRNARSLGPVEAGMRSTAKEFVPFLGANGANGAADAAARPVWQLSEPTSPLPGWSPPPGGAESFAEAATLSSLLQGLGSPNTVKRSLPEDGGKSAFDAKGPFDNNSVYHLSLGEGLSRGAASPFLGDDKAQGGAGGDATSLREAWVGAKGQAPETLDLHLNKLTLENGGPPQVARSDSLGDVRPIIENTAFSVAEFVLHTPGSRSPAQSFSLDSPRLTRTLSNGKVSSPTGRKHLTAVNSPLARMRMRSQSSGTPQQPPLDDMESTGSIEGEAPEQPPLAPPGMAAAARSGNPAGSPLHRARIASKDVESLEAMNSALDSRCWTLRTLEDPVASAARIEQS